MVYLFEIINIIDFLLFQRMYTLKYFLFKQELEYSVQQPTQ
mgnify:CR=1 FL=1